MAEQKDHWSSSTYQHSASFVPKLATKIVQWLDLQPDDVVLDVGCGDGILDLEFGKILAQGSGSLHGIDNSPSMIKSATDLCAKDAPKCTFEVLDATQLISCAKLQKPTFTKAFSNAALHWILRRESTRQAVFDAIHAALAPGGTLAFEMGGLGNVCEMRTALLMAVSRRVGMPAALEADPWFFPDEAWITATLEAAGFRVDKVEREWRPTRADQGGVEGWVRLMGAPLLDAVPDAERDAAVMEAVEVLREVCRNPAGGEHISYVRLRCLATKV
ncbi:S-adenosyl-L-methionine-dependent methyltransferase [Stachybotrys elegans]|uniref:S-adenosyl-L-methionine-dependent methyltransferase n=1 Tax=Stachybotrys elegans TaxID=80388 RepID=A0A8K0WSI4_9HYPO|nr:S-adenosyl-L-methionine-dependent methyltransferase [Stachybotrys elegans]